MAFTDVFDSYPVTREVLSQREKADILQTLSALNLPYGGYFVIGGANMVLRSIKSRTEDIDILVSDEVFVKLQDLPGAELHEPPRRAIAQGADNNTVWVRNPDLTLPVSATTRLGDGYYPLSFETHVSETDLIDGIPCLALHHVEAAKSALQRPKDLLDLDDIARFTGRSIDLPQPIFVGPLGIS